MNMFWREFRALSKSLLIYSIIIFLFTITGFTKFKAYAENPEMLAILDQMPAVVLDAMNMRTFNLTTLSGFYGIMHVYYALILGIAAVMWGSDIIAKEERDKTVEFSLVLPVPRHRIVTAKLLAAIVHSLLLLGVSVLSVLVSSRSYTPDEKFWDFLKSATLGLFLLQIVFLAIGLLLACAMQQYRRVGSIAIGILLGSYFLSILAALHEKADFLKYFTPFKYVDAGMIWRKGHIETPYLLLSLLIIAACTAGAYWSYNRRDLYI